MGLHMRKAGKTLRRYLIREVAAAFAAGLVIFTFILLIARILELVDLVLARGVPGTKVLALFAYIMPSFLELTIPMALLLAVVAAFSRLASDGELLAMRAVGLHLYQLAAPIALLAAVIACTTLALAMFARPWANRQIKTTVYDIAKTRAAAALRPRMFNTDFPGLVVYVDAIEAETGIMSGIMIADERRGDRRITIFSAAGKITADEGRRDLYLQLLDGTSLSYDAEHASYDTTYFDSLEVHLDLERDAGVSGPAVPRGPSEMNWGDLLKARDQSLAGGKPAIEENIEIHRKFVLSAAAILLAILGIPLGAQRSNAVRARSMAVSLIVILCYYLLLSASMTLVRRSNVDVALGMWMPNVVLAAVAAILFVRAGADLPALPQLPLSTWPRRGETSRAARQSGQGRDD